MSIRSRWMCCIIQVDFPQQMEVFRWICNDDSYRIIWIRHDRDLCEEDRVRVDADGKEVQLYKGQPKPDHIHCIIKLPNKSGLTAETFSKRFGNYVHFQICADPEEYAKYFTHDTFDSCNKAHYESMSVCGDRALYYELLKHRHCDDLCSMVSHFSSIVGNCGDYRSAIEQVCSAGDADLLRSVMSHAYFYKTLFDERWC